MGFTPNKPTPLLPGGWDAMQKGLKGTGASLFVDCVIFHVESVRDSNKQGPIRRAPAHQEGPHRLQVRGADSGSNSRGFAGFRG